MSAFNLEQIAELMTEGFVSVAIEDATYMEDDDGQPEVFEHVSAEFKDRAAEIVDEFLALPGVPALVEAAIGPSRSPAHCRVIGADLYMSVVGHGVDFRDSGYPGGEELAKAAEPLDYSFSAYVGDDGVLYA